MKPFSNCCIFSVTESPRTVWIETMSSRAFTALAIFRPPHGRGLKHGGIAARTK